MNIRALNAPLSISSGWLWGDLLLHIPIFPSPRFIPFHPFPPSPPSALSPPSQPFVHLFETNTLLCVKTNIHVLETNIHVLEKNIHLLGTNTDMCVETNTQLCAETNIHLLETNTDMCGRQTQR